MDRRGQHHLGTAGHCVEGTGGRVSTPGHGAWGTVVLDLDGDTDFALLRVDDAKVPMVRAAVQHWGGPTGVSAFAATDTVPVVLYGYGVGFSVSETTRAKQGVLLNDDDTQYIADTWAVPGDSGAPVLLKDTREALGVVSSFNLPLSTDIGPTVAHIQAELQRRGWNLELQLAEPTTELV